MASRFNDHNSDAINSASLVSIKVHSLPPTRLLSTPTTSSTKLSRTSPLTLLDLENASPFQKSTTSEESHTYSEFTTKTPKYNNNSPSHSRKSFATASSLAYDAFAVENDQVPPQIQSLAPSPNASIKKPKSTHSLLSKLHVKRNKVDVHPDNLTTPSQNDRGDDSNSDKEDSITKILVNNMPSEFKRIRREATEKVQTTFLAVKKPKKNKKDQEIACLFSVVCCM